MGYLPNRHSQVGALTAGDVSFTRVPNALLDAMGELSSSEVLVILYVLRRTVGFNKLADLVSLAQLSKGMRFRDGRRADTGTGLSKRTVQSAVDRLKERGLIDVEWSGSGPKLFSVNDRGLARFREKTQTRRGWQNHAGGQACDALVGVQSRSPEGEHFLPPQNKAERQEEKNAAAMSLQSALNDLHELGVSTRTAELLLSEFGVDRVVSQVDGLKFRRGVRNPAAFIVRAIEESYPLPERAQPVDQEQSRKTSPVSQEDGAAIVRATAERLTELWHEMKSFAEVISWGKESLIESRKRWLSGAGAGRESSPALLRYEPTPKNLIRILLQAPQPPIHAQRLRQVFGDYNRRALNEALDLAFPNDCDAL